MSSFAMMQLLRDSGVEGLGGDGGDVNTAPVVTESVSDEIVELNEAAQDVVDHDDTAETVVEAAEGLESLYQIIQSTLPNGGMTPTEAQLAHNAYKGHMSKFGALAVSPVGAVESFGGKSMRRQQTVDSCESLKEQIGKLWDWLRGLIEKGRKAISDYYERVWAAAPRTRGKAEAIFKKAEGVEGKVAKNKTHSVSAGMVEKLSLTGKIATDIPAALKALSATSDTLFNKYPAESIKWSADVVAAVEKLKFGSDAEFDTSLNDVKKLKPFTLADIKLTPLPTSDERLKGVTTGYGKSLSAELLGGKAIIRDTRPASKDVRSKITEISGTRYYLGDFAAKSPTFNELPNFATLTPTTVKAITDHVVDICNVVEKFKRATTDADAAKKAALAAGDSVNRDAKSANELTGPNVTIATKVVDLLNAVPAIVDQPNQRFSAHIMSVCSAALSLCDKSLAQY